MRRSLTGSVFGLIVLAVASCGPTAPSRSVSGYWQSPGLKFQGYALAITENGDRISGVACSYSAGKTVFANVPVTGNRPDVWFAVGASTFIGKYEEERDQIAGDFGRLPLRFNRAEHGQCGRPE
jgi:hypothetical protein